MIARCPGFASYVFGSVRAALVLSSLAVACAPADPVADAPQVVTQASALEAARACPPRGATPFVTTVRGPAPGVGDALSTDSRGRVYASDFIGSGTVEMPNGTTVSRIERDGTLTPFVTAIPGPAGTAFDSKGRFYVAAFLSGEVYRRDPDGTVSVVASGLQGPTGLAIDDQDRAYVSLAGLTGPGTSVVRIAPDGAIDTFVDLGLGPAPIFALGGLAFDDQGRLYVANFLDGRIVRVTPDGVAAPFATIDGLAGFPAVGYLAFADGTLYGTGIGSNRVYAIDAAGLVSTLAGTGEALERDGRAAQAAFAGPNGIAVGRQERSLFIADTTTRTLRRIAGLKR